MDNFDLKKYLAENKLLKENIDSLFNKTYYEWTQSFNHYDFDDLEPGPIEGSLVDTFELNRGEAVGDGKEKDFDAMQDYLLKNKTYKIKFPSPREEVTFTLKENSEEIATFLESPYNIVVDIYMSPEYLKTIGV
tara:strand:- start:2651 stop:3052 length:402 start_codon:yes stop_codon:yes gene_type:complete